MEEIKYKIVDAIPYQVCPLCNGNGKVLADGFTSNVYATCPVCNDQRIIPMHVNQLKDK